MIYDCKQRGTLTSSLYISTASGKHTNSQDPPWLAKMGGVVLFLIDRKKHAIISL